MTAILQFGTSRFLQAHVDLFLSEGAEALGQVTVVQSSGDAGRAGRLAALAEGYPVRIQGLEGGREVRREVRVTSVARTLSTATDWEEVCAVGTQARIILSNTSEKGLVAQPCDGAPAFDQAMSWPAKLTHLLRARHRAGGGPVQVMPTELVAQNGASLRARVLDLAPDADFAAWVAAEVTFVNSLVDRIVSAPLEPAGAVAEPYALWAIQDCPGLVTPVRHPAVQVVPDLGPIERRKLYILNLGHTWLISQWLTRGGADYVRQLMADADWRGALESLYAEEVLPVFAAAGDASAPAYVAATLDRFANPFLDHRLADIAQNHGEKLRARIGAFLNWAKDLGLEGQQPRLTRALG